MAFRGCPTRNRGAVSDGGEYAIPVINGHKRSYIVLLP